MADSDLKDRLRDHAKAFDGLLSLIPAKVYYGQDVGDQWMKKKQTKEQAGAARRGKLDPDSELNRNAKEVMDERARNKRKLQQMQEEGDEPVDVPASGKDDQNEEEEEEEDGEEEDTSSGIEKEKPGEGLKKKLSPPPAAAAAADTARDDRSANKKPKLDKDADTSGPGHVEAGEAEVALKSKKQAEREAKRLAKKAKKAKKEEKKKLKTDNSANDKGKSGGGKGVVNGEQVSEETKCAPSSEPQHVQPSTEVDDHKAKHDCDLIPMDVSGLVPPDQLDAKDGGDDNAESRQTTDESLANSAVFDDSNKPADVPSPATSISSAVAPSEKPGHIKIPADTTALRARLAAKIAAFRAARKADGTNGRPIRTRQELIESRRQEETRRKARKKELRRQEKEARMREREEVLASSRNSPASVLSPVIGRSDDGQWGDEPDEQEGGKGSPDKDDSRNDNHFSFGKIAFSDGTQMSHDLSYEKAAGSSRKKGPSDVKTALLKVQADKQRVAGMAEDKRKEVLERETWLAARRRTEGERPRDDEALLKKAVRRKEQAKKKTKREWGERAEGVAQASQDRQRKRDDNLRKRKEDKVGRRSGKGKKNKGVVTRKKPNRPGFEGGFGGGGKRK